MCIICQYFISSLQKPCKVDGIIPIWQKTSVRVSLSHTRTIPDRTKTQTQHYGTNGHAFPPPYTAGTGGCGGWVYSIPSVKAATNLEPENMGVVRLYHVLAIPP